MGFFSGFVSTFGNTIKTEAQGAIRSAAQQAVSGISSRMFAGFGGSGATFSGLTPELSNSKAILSRAMRIRYAQGWQWNIEIEGFAGLDMYVKDITYGFGNIETETTLIGSVEFNKPTHATAGTLTVTVRDNEQREVRNWFLERKRRVTNSDGTLNLPRDYLMKARIYSVDQDGKQTLLESVDVFPTQFGEVSFARDQLTEFCSYPLTFVRYTSAESSLGGMAKNLVGSQIKGAVSGMVSSGIGKIGSFF
ncbi:phage tail protein [Rosenbergiella collisarenosi]|uniref:phage tail protein n=1 Tax=Rosenbergiella collisarenosi TaxID=1544695 RepID=UPI001F4E5AC4|nr:phage tail protein [Rosenbergiella collisarenosi]